MTSNQYNAQKTLSFQRKAIKLSNKPMNFINNLHYKFVKHNKSIYFISQQTPKSSKTIHYVHNSV